LQKKIAIYDQYFDSWSKISNFWSNFNQKMVKIVFYQNFEICSGHPSEKDTLAKANSIVAQN